MSCMEKACRMDTIIKDQQKNVYKIQWEVSLQTANCKYICKVFMLSYLSGNVEFVIQIDLLIFKNQLEDLM